MIILAFLVVAGSCALMIPVMLYVFQLHSKGWTWQYAALFGSMLASTDAVAIIATMKSSKLLPAMLSNQTKIMPVYRNTNHCSGCALTCLTLQLLCTVCLFGVSLLWYVGQHVSQPAIHQASRRCIQCSAAVSHIQAADLCWSKCIIFSTVVTPTDGGSTCSYTKSSSSQSSSSSTFMSRTHRSG